MTAPVFGIDIGGTLLRVMLARDAAMGEHRKRPTDADGGPAEAVDAIRAMMDELAGQAGLALPDVAAIGVGVPGPSDFERGILIDPPNLPLWHEAPLGEMLTAATGIPTHLQNDANLAAYGELHHGAGRGAGDMVYVTVSTGIGGGIIIDGRLYSGSGGTAGEVGHIVVEAEGPTCHCGARGCLEMLASGTAIARVARARVASGESTSLSGRAEIDAADVSEAAAAGDAVALEVLHQAGRYLGLGLGSILNILDPELLVLGGGAIQAGEPLLQPMRLAIELQAFPSTFSHVRIELAELGQDAGLIGAAQWARDRLAAT